MTDNQVLELLSKCKEYYESNSAGGNLHIVLDDENTEDENLEFCRNECIKEKDGLGLEIANLLLSLSVSDRDKICNNYYLYRA